VYRSVVTRPALALALTGVLVLCACGARPQAVVRATTAASAPPAVRTEEPALASPEPTPSPVATATPPPAGPTILKHTAVQQAFSASCEAAAAAQAMRISGYGVSEKEMIAAMVSDPRPPELAGRTVVRWGNPWKAFVGSQDGWWPWKRYDPNHATGYGVYAPPVLDAVRKLGAPKARGGTGISVAELRSAIRAGHPAVIWLPSRHDFETLSNSMATGTWVAWDGTSVTYALHEHVQTLLGTDEGGFYVGSPDYQWTPGYPFLSYWTDAEFARAFAFLNNMAIIVE
jgi:uncharacterized protein YvpB